jgi:hypothetical protein
MAGGRAVTYTGGPLPPYSIPIHASMESGFTLCRTVNLTIPPAHFPFHTDLITATGCDGPGISSTIGLSEIASTLERETREEYWHSPVGFIIHAMRVGSTAAANMFGAHEDVVVLKETSAISDILLWPAEAIPGRQEYVTRALRAAVHLFFRSAASQRLSLLMSRGVSQDAATRRAAATCLVFKLASASTASAAQLHLLRAAFPDTPFAYLVRDPVASVASLLAPPRVPHELFASPCLRWRGRLAAAQLPGLLKKTKMTDPLSLTLEQYCAAHLGSIHGAMLQQIHDDGGLADTRRRTLVFDHSALPGVVLSEVFPHFGLEADTPTRARALEYGSLNAKDPRAGTGYKSRASTAAVSRWATAFAGLTYARLMQLANPVATSEENRDVSVARKAAAAALSNVSAGVGRFAHTAGLTGSPTLVRRCAASEMAGPLDFVDVAESGFALFRQSDFFGAEACWVEALRMTSSPEARAVSPASVDTARDSILVNLAMVEGVISREDQMRLIVATTEEKTPKETLKAAPSMHG